MKSALTLLFIAVLAWSGYQLWSGYRAAEGSPWQRLVATFRNSATMAVLFVARAIDALAGSLEGISSWLNVPEVQAVMQRYLTPDAMLLVMLAVVILSEIARRRTLRRV